MEHRQYLKNSMYEGSTRVPLIFSHPSFLQGITVYDHTSLLGMKERGRGRGRGREGKREGEREVTEDYLLFAKAYANKPLLRQSEAGHVVMVRTMRTDLGFFPLSTWCARMRAGICTARACALPLTQRAHARTLTSGAHARTLITSHACA